MTDHSCVAVCSVRIQPERAVVLQPGRICGDPAHALHDGQWLCYPHAKRAGWKAPSRRDADYWERRYSEHMARVRERVEAVCGGSSDGPTAEDLERWERVLG